MSDKIKMSFDFTQKAVDFYESLYKRSGLPNRAAVLTRALRMYDFFLTKKSTGYRLALVKDKDIQFVDTEFNENP